MYNLARCRHLFALLALLALAACGFQMRGAADFSFHSLYVQQGAPAIMPDLKRLLKINNITLATKPEEAEMQLDLMSESTQRRILSLSGGGTVSEFELIYRLTFRTRAAGSELWSAPQTVEDRRDFSYDNSQLLAKDYEEARLFSDMRADSARKVMRRLSVLKSGAPNAAN